MKEIAFTIVSKNYLAHAISLGRSFLQHNNQSFMIYLCDLVSSQEELDLLWAAEQHGIEVCPFYQLRNKMSIPELENMATKYSIVEMNTAIKPYVIDFLFKSGYEKVMYFDPDILVFGSLSDLYDKLGAYDVVLTPHITQPYPDDGKSPSDLTILSSGTYNLGYLGIRNSDQSQRFVDWWKAKLEDQCYMDVPAGMHVDQKWLDFAPSFVEKVLILKDKRYNIAYWNLHERNLEHNGSVLIVDGQPAVFFHFSGFDMQNISKHQDRFGFSDIPALKTSFTEYADILRDNGIDQTKKMEYYFSKIPGTSILIPDVSRVILRNEGVELLNTDDAKEVFSSLNLEVCPRIKKIFLEIYKRRWDLQKAFPDVENNVDSRRAFFQWTRNSPQKEYGLHEAFIDSEGSIEKYADPDPFGVNLWGYFDACTGVGESARTLWHVLCQTGLPFSVLNIPAEGLDTVSGHPDIEHLKVSSNPYSVNISMVNADQTPHVINEYGSDKFDGKYHIGFWAWELEGLFPHESSFDLVDEIWYWSEFGCRIFRKRTGKPVIRVPYSVTPNWGELVKRDAVRQSLCIPDESFVFMFAFDYMSCYERKNPQAVINAFKIAKRKMPGAKLVIKTTHHEKSFRKHRELTRFAAAAKDVIFVNKSLDRNSYMSLLNACDSYVSLHRSEGLGIGMLEAMYLGKPVIATSYGGIAEVLTSQNSFPVGYKMCDIREDFGPYKKGYLWANPDSEQAARFMEVLYSQRTLAKSIGAEAKRTVVKMAADAKSIVLDRLRKLDLR